MCPVHKYYAFIKISEFEYTIHTVHSRQSQLMPLNIVNKLYERNIHTRHGPLIAQTTQNVNRSFHLQFQVLAKSILCVWARLGTITTTRNLCIGQMMWKSAQGVAVVFAIASKLFAHY